MKLLLFLLPLACFFGATDLSHAFSPKSPLILQKPTISSTTTTTTTTTTPSTAGGNNRNPRSSGGGGGGLWLPNQMVAGGAEKAYGEEYYDGMSLV